ncbi:hypothetical protein LEP1GSC050_3143 [Leptospira broomii serovar Hurstbridge str. 5399]|uniref:Uncharacterized protein n=1 Tax=Leptospira broomii serovar Hurstbridge str. 5399 TaxID=1049789 RepID=T0GAT3_9LEPT|nr:hypothetical protein LEP1GSC050_3143 [Leptospira broomii serovar Hurstbridge str. 5399]
MERIFTYNFKIRGTHSTTDFSDRLPTCLVPASIYEKGKKTSKRNRFVMIDRNQESIRTVEIG